MLFRGSNSSQAALQQVFASILQPLSSLSQPPTRRVVMWSADIWAQTGNSFNRAADKAPDLPARCINPRVFPVSQAPIPWNALPGSDEESAISPGPGFGAQRPDDQAGERPPPLIRCQFLWTLINSRLGIWLDPELLGAGRYRPGALWSPTGKVGARAAAAGIGRAVVADSWEVLYRAWTDLDLLSLSTILGTTQDIPSSPAMPPLRLSWQMVA